jgi:hypothetical protein
MHKGSGAKNANKAAMRVQKRKLSTKKQPKKTKLVPKKSLTVQKRFGATAVDAQGRPLPVDYESAHLHDSYDYYYPDTSKMFDEHPQFDAWMAANPTPELFDELKDKQREATLNQIPIVRASIKDPKELDAFENILVSSLTAIDNIKSKDEIIYTMEKRGITKPAQLEPFENNFKQFFTNDLKFGTPAQKFETIVHHAIMWSSAGILAYTGVDACVQYFYDVEFPLHGDHDH